MRLFYQFSQVRFTSDFFPFSPPFSLDYFFFFLFFLNIVISFISSSSNSLNMCSDNKFFKQLFTSFILFKYDNYCYQCRIIYNILFLLVPYYCIFQVYSTCFIVLYATIQYTKLEQYYYYMIFKFHIRKSEPKRKTQTLILQS